MSTDKANLFNWNFDKDVGKGKGEGMINSKGDQMAILDNYQPEPTISYTQVAVNIHQKLQSFSCKIQPHHVESIVSAWKD